MKNELVAVNVLVETINVNIKSIYKTSGQAGDVYKCKRRGDVYYCYVLIVKGKMILRSLQFNQIELSAGQAMFLWSNEILSYSFNEETEYFWVYFSLTEKKLVVMKPFPVSLTEKNINNFYRCASLLNRSTIVDLIRANMIFTKYVLDGIEKLLAEETSAMSWHRMTIEMSMDYIKDNLCNLPTIQELATMADMSLKQYRKHFKKIIGEYPAKYIYEQRLLLAKEYLVNTNLSVAQIAEVMCFSSAYYLCTCFKKMFGCSPSEYRKKFEK